MDYIKQYKSFVNSHYLSDGVRITAGISLPAIVLGYFHDLSAGIVLSVGAMCVAVTDNPGPIHHRRNGMMACMAIIFAEAVLTGFAVARPVFLDFLVFGSCFVFSMIGIYGSRASSVGIAALLVMVLNIDHPYAGGRQVLINALLVLAGGAWYTLLSLLLYSFRPYKLTQQALGDCIQSTALYLQAKASFYERQPDFDKNYRQLVDQQIIVHEKQDLIRELLFKSRDIVKESTHRGRVLVMIFLDIVDLFERVMTSHQDYKTLHALFDDGDILEQYRLLILDMVMELDTIGIAVKSGRPSEETPFLAGRVAALRDSFIKFRDSNRTAGNVEGFISLRHILESMQDIADRIHTLHGYTTYDALLEKRVKPAIDYEQFITHQDIDQKLLWENFTLQSNIFRHSLRVSIATMAGVLVSNFFPFGHSYWILLTIIVILKPAYSLTKRRNYERLTGTLAGALIGLLILYFITDPTVLFVLMILLMIGTYSFLRTRYLVSVVFMTPYILLLFHLLNPHHFSAVLLDRVIDTVIGSAIAFLANIFFIPSWEQERVIEYMGKTVEDNIRYFRDVSEPFLGRTLSVNRYKLSRKKAFVSLANLSDAFSRMLSEPRSKQKNVGYVHEFVVANHMLTSHIATLAYYMGSAMKYASPDYQPVIEASIRKLNQAHKILEQGVPAIENPVVKEDLRVMNDRVNTLIKQRKAELDQGVLHSETRNQLSEFKPIVDQFNFIAKVAGDIERLSRNLHPASIERAADSGGDEPGNQEAGTDSGAAFPDLSPRGGFMVTKSQLPGN
ncbi:MAG: FUSC family membrane protein [Puia sp.]|nr:FUSC family membrane protein [Puia sp.]